MSALRAALDIPDDPPRHWRGVPLGVAASVVWIVVGVVFARTFALGGSNSSARVVGLLLAVPAFALAWVLTGAHRHRTWIVAAVIAAALVAVPIALSGATLSTDRLRSLANGLGLPGKVARDVTLGSGRCRPECSELRRTAFVDDIAFSKVRAEVIGALRADGYTVHEYARLAGNPLRIDAAKSRVLVSLELRDLSLTRTRIAAIFLAQGPAPDTSVG